MNLRVSKYACLAMMVASVLFTGGPVYGASIYSNNFEMGMGPEWSLPTLEGSVQNPFTTFSGRFNNNTQTLTVSNLVQETQYSLFFDLYIFDTWDGGNDRFNVDVASSNRFNHSFHFNASSQTYPEPPDLGPVNYGFSGTTDSIYRNIEIPFEATSNIVQVSWYGSGLQAVNDESWGIDNILIQTMSPTSIDDCSLPSGTTTAAIDWFTVTALRILSETASTNAASYDLRGAGLDGSFDTPDDALYTLLPSYSGGKTVTLSIGNNAPLQPGTYRFLTTTNLQDSVGGTIASYTNTFTITETSNRTVEDLDNGSLGTADSLNPLFETPGGSGFLTATAIGTLDGTADYDYWTFDAEAGDVLSAWMVMDRDAIYPYIKLLNASGTQLLSDRTWTSASRIQNYTVTTPGTYYLLVHPYYDVQPPVGYELRLDIGRGRRLEAENNNNQSQANHIGWTVDGSSLKDASAGALLWDDDYLNLGHLSQGNAMSVNLRFPAGSELNASNVMFEIQTPSGTLYTTNTPLFAFDIVSNATHYLKMSTSNRDVLSQYVLDLTILDTAPPEIASDNLLQENSTNTVFVDRFTMGFSEYMDRNTVIDTANYSFISAGDDDIFGNGDDEVYSLSPSYTANALSASYSITDGPLQPDRNFRFTVSTNLTDRVGNSIAIPYVREFRLENIDLYIHENRNNGSIGLATPLGVATNTNDGTVVHAHTATVGDYPTDVISADLDGDLAPDLVTCNLNSDTITILSGNGDGSFSVVTNMYTGDGPRQAVLGHFNGDSYFDLAVAHENSDTLSVFIGQAGGTFLPASNYSVPDRPWDVKAGDLNGDGHTDLASVSYNANMLTVHYGDGTGAFSTSTNYPTGTNPLELSLAHLNNDANLDIVVANLSSDNASVFLNNGDGTLGTATNFSVGDAPHCLVVGDLDNDGEQDLVVGNHNADTIGVLLGLGDGSFGPVTNYSGCNGPVDVDLLDLDSDGFKDVAVASYSGHRLNFFENQGDGTFAFSSHQHTINHYPHSIAVNDFNMDGLNDLAVANTYYDQIYAYLSNQRIILEEDPSGSGLHSGFGRGNITSTGDYDYWSFSGEQGDRVVMAIETPGNPASSGLRYQLVSPEGVNLGNYAAHSTGYGQSPVLTLTSSGRYSILVYYNHQYWSEYRIRLSKVPATMQMDYENNNSTGTANSLSFEVNGSVLEASVAGCIGKADGSGDYYSLGNLTSGTVVNVTLSKPSSSGLLQEIDLIGADGIPATFTSNRALRLGGTATDYGIVNPFSNFPTTAFTAEFWMKTANTSKNGSPISYARTGQDNEVLLFDYRNFDPYVGNSTYATGVAGNNDRWNHIAWTWDSVTGSSLFYKNGELVHSNGNWRTAYNIIQGGSFVVGQDQDSVGGGFDTSQAFLGELDELRLWNNARSQAEIQAGLGGSLAGTESGLVGYWNFEDGTANDLSALGNDLSLFGNSQIVYSDLNGDPGNPETYPTNLQYTATSSGIHYVRIRDALQIGDLQRQYVFNITMQDGVAPLITSITLPVEGTNSVFVTDRFNITFSEEMDADSINNPANYELRTAGLDTLLDTADDEIYTIVPSYSSGLQASYIISDGPLQLGAVRFTASIGLTDRSGNPMSADHLRSFTISNPSGLNLETRDNGSVATATSLGSAITNEADGSFSAAGSFAVGTNPYALVMTNFNGDTHLDIATANYSSDSATILLGNGDGTFLLATNIATGNGSISLEPGLFNADAHMDLAVANYLADTVTVLLGDGTGGFVNWTNHYVGDAPYDIDVGDMDNDGILDLVVCNEISDNVGVLLGNGDGSFAPAIFQSCGDRPFSVAVGDIDGDGTNDVAVANNNDNTMGMLIGNGDGTLQSAISYAAGSDPRSVEIMDVNQDSVQDIVVANFSSDNITLYRGLGGGALTNMGSWYTGNGPWGDIPMADFNGDGRMDLACAQYYGGQLAIIEQGSDGSLGNVSLYATGGSALDTAIGDVNEDGVLDFAVINYNVHNVKILLGNHREMLPESLPSSGLSGSFGHGNISEAGDYDYWSFSGLAGDIATVALSLPGHPDGSRLRFDLYRPDGGHLGTWYGNHSGGSGQSVPVTLPVSGRYAVGVSQYNTYRGEYHMAVQLARPPLQVESEANGSYSVADAPVLSLSAGRQEADVAGFLLHNTGFDYYSLGNLASGTVVQATLELPAFHGMYPYLDVVDSGGAIITSAAGMTSVLNLDGTSDYLRHTTTNINPRSGTVEGWIFPREDSDFGFWQTHDSTSQNWADWISMFSYPANTFYFRTGNGSSGASQDLTFTSTSYIPSFQWTHLAFTWGGTSLKIYANGALIASRNDATLQDTMDPFAIMGLGHGRWLDGWLEEMRVWDRPLTQIEINTVRNQTLTGSESGLVSYWDFNGDVLDATTNGNHGTLFGEAMLVTNASSPYELTTNITSVTSASGTYYVRVGGFGSASDLKNQYVVHLSAFDSTIPTITAETLPGAGSTNAGIIDVFSVTFSEEMQDSTVISSENFELVSAGADGLFDTVDDSPYSLVGTYSSGLTATFEVIDGPLQPGLIRFMAGTNVLDRSGTSLEPYTNIFSMVGLEGFLFESRSNNSGAEADGLNLFSTNLFDGTYSIAQTFATGDQPLDMVSGLFNADTNLDLAVINYSSDSVTIYLGNGDTTFVTATNIAVGDGPHGIVTGLFDADANLDLAVANHGSDTVTILMGNGAGAFSNVASYACGNGPTHMVYEDMNNDGINDLVVANQNSDSVGVLPGNGDGTFSTVIETYTDDGAYGVAVADLNQDGTNDVAVANRYADTLSLLWGQGDGSFFAATNIVMGDEPRRVVAEDFNLDGKPDLAICNWGSDNVSVLMASGGGAFAAAQNTWVGDTPWLSGQDVDGDTVMDLLVACRNPDSVGVLFGDGFGQFSAPQVSVVGDGPIKVLAGQFDALPGMELAVLNYDADTLQILSPNTTELMAIDTADGLVRTQHGRGNLHNSSDIDYWTFDGEAGHQISLATLMPSLATYSRLQFRIYRPDGVLLVNYYSPHYGYGQSTPVTLPVGGRYLMSIGNYNNFSGEYNFRLTTLAPPRLFETEANNNTGQADLPNYVLQSSSRSAQMAGFIHGNDTSGDYYQLGNLGVGTTINLSLEWPESSTLSASLAIYGPQGLVTQLSPATNLVHVTTTNGNFYALVNDASSTRGLDAQYLLNLLLSDSTPPEITSVSLPAEGSEVTTLISSFTVGFSEAMDATTVTDPANYELRGAGDDGLLDTPDDDVYSLVPGAYAGGSSISIAIDQPPLQAGTLRLTISQTLSDILANGMVAPYQRTFIITENSGIGTETRSNDSTGTASPFEMVEELSGLRSGDARGALLNTSDLDYFSFTASSNDTVIVGVDSPSYGTYHRLRFRLVDTNNTVLAELLTPHYTERGQTAPFIIPSDGTYYVRVSYYDDYRGEYNIHVMVASDPQMLETEDNGTIGTANALAMDTSSSNAVGSIGGYVGHVADNDYYEIGSVSNDQTILVGVRVPNDSGLVPVVSVYNSAGAYQSEEGATGDGSAEVRVSESNRYFVVVRSGENTGGLGKDYIMDVEVLPTAAVVIPNLGVTQVSPPSGLGVLSGDAVLVSYIVQNIGSAPTQEGAWFDRVVLSSNKVMGDADDYPLGNIAHIGNLDMGAAYTNQSMVMLPEGINGDFYIVVYSDFGDLVDERLFEGDNIAASAATFPVMLADYPDLKVEDLQVSGSNEVGQVLSISWNTANRGATAVDGSVSERLRILRVDNGAELYSQDYTVSGPLAVDAVVPHSVMYTTVHAVAHNVVVETDTANAYYEFDAVSHASAEQNSATAGASLLKYYNVTTAPNPLAAGSVAGGGYFPAGTIVTVSATVNTNTLPYAFFNWTENGAFRSSSTNYSFLLSRNFNLVANFGLPQFALTAIRVPEAGGLVTGAGSFDYASTNILRAYPNPGYGFDHWQEGPTQRGSALSVTNVLFGNREMTAVFYELNPFHTVTTASDPDGVAGVSGAGHYTNGNSTVFAAPQIVTTGANRYLFQRLELNGSLLASTNSYLNTFSTQQPSNMHVVASYTAQLLEPQVKSVVHNQENPVPATTNFLADIVFDRSMQTNIQPLVVFTNIAAPELSFVASSNGVWLTTHVANDTYSLEPVTFGVGDDGTYGVLVSQATDLYDEAINMTNAASVEVNSTPPDNPVFMVASSNATSFTLSWTGYTPPADLDGFRLYRETNSFSSVSGLAPVGYALATVSNATVNGIQLDTDYYLGVAAVDIALNSNPAVTGLMARVDSVLPPAVAVTAVPVGANGVDLSWSGYATTGLFGLEGFQVFWQQTNFNNVASLTPYSTLSPSQNSVRLEGLDRRYDHYFAVVGYNRLGQQISAVSTVLWKDPFGGTIDENLIIGTGGAHAVVHDIYRDIVVDNNAVLTIEPGVTLRFAEGTGLRVEQGALSALGTVFSPIVLTSAEASPAPGDWAGLYLGPAAGASEMTHLWTMYGEGLRIDGCEPDADALSVLFNTPAGLTLEGNSLLVTSNLLAQFNAVGLRQLDAGQLVLGNSMIVNNDTNAWGGGSATMSAADVWWGSTDNAEVFAGVAGSVDYAPFLGTEPLLTPAADTADGIRNVGSRSVKMKYACRVAESMRISEDSTFANVFFQNFASTNTVLLSEGGGAKTLYVQYRNVNGETNAPIVIPLSYITAGPTIAQFNLSEGQVVERPFIVTCAATSPLGVASAEFYVDNTLVASTNAASMNVLWDIRNESSGTHRVKFVARDPNGAFTVSEANVYAAPEPPPAPTITLPTNGTVTASSTVTVSGTAEPFIGLRILRNGAVVATTTANGLGVFSTAANLLEGKNNLVASAYDALGDAVSRVSAVNLDTGSPVAPILDSAVFSVDDGVDLTWYFQETGERPSSFKVFWHTAPFTNSAEASASGPVVYGAEYGKDGLADGTYYFGVVGYDGAGNPSPLSNVISADYDTTAPSFTIGYNKSSPVGTGSLQITLSADESLSGLPDLLVLPDGASSPTVLVLSNTAPNTFVGVLNVNPATPSGPAEVRVSARDLYGNPFTGSPDGIGLSIDTTPPTGSIVTLPAAPVQVLSNATMQVNLTLSEPPKAGTTPLIEFDPPAGATVNVVMSGSGQNWSGTLILNPLMGNGFCDFDLSVSDSLDNAGSVITSGETLEIYNTALPTSPSAPNLLAPVAKKGGFVNLVWYPVDNAETYSVYRMPGDSGTPVAVVTSGIVSNGVADLPPTDGNYRYAVSASRRGAESDLSQVYTKFSDRTPPNAPSNVVVQLQASGVQLTWDVPASGEAPIRYNAYRNGTLISSPYVPTPINDYPPRGTSDYVVASADWLGNEAFSTTNQFIMLVPAVASFNVLMHENQSPSLSWTTGDPSIVGVNIYRRGFKINGSPLATTSFVDSNYSGSSKVDYEIRSVDGAGQEGPGRVADVYRLDMGLGVNECGTGLPLLYYFDDYLIAVTNRTLDEVFPLGSVEVRRTYSGGPVATVNVETNMSIGAGATSGVAIPVAGMTNATAQNVRVRLEQDTGISGSKVTYQRLFAFTDSTTDSEMLSVTVTNSLVVGALNNFEVRVFNRGCTEMDVVTMRANGAQDGDIYLAIFNGLGQEVGRVKHRGSLPGMSVTANGTGYVTIQPGDYIDVSIPDVLVPAALAGDSSLLVRGGVVSIGYRTGTSEEQLSGPLVTTETFGLVESAYYGTSATDKANYANDEQVVITGKALHRADNAPLPETDLHIGFAIGQYRWFEDVTTDTNGNYSFTYNVPQGISGKVAIWAAHPDVVDRLDQTTIGVYRMFVLPRFGDIRMSKNDTYIFSVNLLNPGTTALKDLGATVDVYRMDGTNKVAIASLGATPQLTSTTLAANARLSVPIQLQAAIDAPDNAVVEIRFASAAQGAADTLTLNLTLLPAVPVVSVVEPASGYVDVTVNRGRSVVRTVTLVNRGLRNLKGVKMTQSSTHGWMQAMLLPEADGFIHLPDLPVGGSNTFDVVFSPPEGLAMDRYNDSFVVSGTNHNATINVPLYATVSSADKGDVQFFVQNTLSIPVPGATIRMRSRLLGTELEPLKTGTNGIVVAESLQEGLWFWQVNAPGHAAQAGSIEVVPDQIVEVSSRLTKNVVTVNFTVVPVPFTDRYEIRIEQTFETHVPAPVLILTPPFKSFTNVEPGFSVRYMMTAKNHGLIRLKDVEIAGEVFSWGSITPLVEYLPELNPFQEIQIPVLVQYWGEEDGSGQSQQGAYANCVKEMFGAIDNFGSNLLKLLTKLSGQSECPNSLDRLITRANNMNQLEKKIVEKAWEKVSEYMTPTWVMKAAALIGCAFTGNGDGNSNTGPGYGPGNDGGVVYSPTGAECFAPGTLVLLEDGNEIPVEKLAAGDVVKCGELDSAVAEVAEVSEGIAHNWVAIQFDDNPDDNLVVTDEHLVWVDGAEKGWTAARNLAVGDAVFGANGTRIKVADIERITEERPFISVRLHGDVAMYANGILVHDQCGWWSPPRDETQSGEVTP